MSGRLRAGRGPSPLYCGACGGRISEMRPDSCVNGTAHTPETDMEHTQAARAADVDPVSDSERILGSSPHTSQAPAAVPAGPDTSPPNSGASSSTLGGGADTLREAERLEELTEHYREWCAAPAFSAARMDAYTAWMEGVRELFAALL